MKPAQANFINGLVLVILGLWGYWSGTQSPGGGSPTALIAPCFGLLFLILTPPFRKDNKVVAHIVVLLTFLLIVALVMPFNKAIGRGDSQAMLRVGTMLLSCVIALVVFIQSFIKARRDRQS